MTGGQAIRVPVPGLAASDACPRRLLELRSIGTRDPTRPAPSSAADPRPRTEPAEAPDGDARPPPSAARFHADRAAGGDRHHRGAGRVVVAGGAGPAREAARRAQCTNNLKQVGLALHNYAATHGALPPGYVSTWDANFLRELGPGWGWGAMILPFLEQQPLADAVDFRVPLQDPAHQTARLTRLAAYLCPSDTMTPTWTTSFGYVKLAAGKVVSATFPICDVASSNYVGVFGVGEPGVDGDGVFYRNDSVAYAQITDGLSQTLAVGERSVLINGGRGQATWTGAVPGAEFYSCPPGLNDPDATGPCVKEDGSGMTLGHTGEGHGPGDPASDVNQFGSRHGRGANFLFNDGHVRFLRQSIHYPTYKAISTRAGGEAISDDF